MGLVGKNGCGKSTLFALLKDELSIDAGSFSQPQHWELAWVAQETPALERSALEYVIDGDREYRGLEQQLAVAEEKTTVRWWQKFTARSKPLAVIASVPVPQNCLTALALAKNR